MAFPSRNWPSHCFKCRHASTECTPCATTPRPRLISNPSKTPSLNPSGFLRHEVRGSNPWKPRSAAAFFNRRRVNPVFRVAIFYTVSAHGFAHRLGIVARTFSHAGPRHARSDRRGIAFRSKIPGKRLLHDDVLSRIRRANRKIMMQGRGHAYINHVNVIPGQQRSVVVGNER
jgi:hypothetical protein